MIYSLSTKGWEGPGISGIRDLLVLKVDYWNGGELMDKKSLSWNQQKIATLFPNNGLWGLRFTSQIHALIMTCMGSNQCNGFSSTIKQYDVSRKFHNKIV